MRKKGWENIISLVCNGDESNMEDNKMRNYCTVELMMELYQEITE